MTVFHEIWSEHSLIDVEQNPVGEFHYFKLREFFDSPTWQIYKKITNRNKRKCWHGFGDWGFVINTAQLFCMNERNWYPIKSLERQSVILDLTALKSKIQNKTYFYRILNFITFLFIYSLWGFSWKQRAHEFFTGGHLRRFQVTLREKHVFIPNCIRKIIWLLFNNIQKTTSVTLQYFRWQMKRQTTSTLLEENLTCEFKCKNSFTLSKSCMKIEQLLLPVKSRFNLQWIEELDHKAKQTFQRL